MASFCFLSVDTAAMSKYRMLMYREKQQREVLQRGRNEVSAAVYVRACCTRVHVLHAALPPGESWSQVTRQIN